MGSFQQPFQGKRLFLGVLSRENVNKLETFLLRIKIPLRGYRICMNNFQLDEKVFRKETKSLIKRKVKAGLNKSLKSERKSKLTFRHTNEGCSSQSEKEKSFHEI